LILNALDSYWLKYDEDPTIDDLELHFKASYNHLSEKKYVLYKTIFEALRTTEAKEEVIHSLLSSYKRKQLLTKLAESAFNAREGSEMELDKVKGIYENLLERGQEDFKEEEEDGFVTTSLSELKEHTIAKKGLRWRLDILNKSLGSLRKGDFGFVFARPETGKTTFLASEITFMAQQAETPVLWFNNEEQGEKVMMRCYQSFFGVEQAPLFANVAEFEAKFQEQMKGKFLMYDTANIYKSQVEKLCKKYKPSLIVFDQIDKIKGFDDDRKDLQLGRIYQWARELAKEYCPVIGVCQADGSGDGVKWLNMGNVADAKTAKQAEADWILGIGKTHDPDFQHKRYLNISKNKLMGDEDTLQANRHGRLEVNFEPTIGRYLDDV
jgi:replicative DNA helicase